MRMSGELNEASLLQLLRRRFTGEMIYTFLGDVLISINPYKVSGLHRIRRKLQYPT
jgi:myosin heavy subunit